MINKKTLHFYQLTFIFAAISILALIYNWGYYSKAEKKESMMNGSMGSMMSSMHLKNIKLSNLFTSESMDRNSSNAARKEQKNNSYLRDLFNLSTIIIIVLLPLIIAASIFLAVVWIK